MFQEAANNEIITKADKLLNSVYTQLLRRFGPSHFAISHHTKIADTHETLRYRRSWNPIAVIIRNKSTRRNACDQLPRSERYSLINQPILAGYTFKRTINDDYYTWLKLRSRLVIVQLVTARLSTITDDMLRKKRATIEI